MYDGYGDTGHNRKIPEKLRDEMPEVDEFMPIEEVGFDHPPVRTDKLHAWLPHIKRMQ